MTIVDLVESMYVPEEEGQDFIDYLSNASNGSEVKLLAAITELKWTRNFTKQVYNFLNILLWIVAFALFSAFSGAYPLYILDEAKNSEAAREMLISGNFWEPTFNESLRTDKPPLL